MENNKFWAVWRKTGGSTPSKRHETKQQAIDEAVRLARQTDEPYYVLQSIGIVQSVKVPVSYTEFQEEEAGNE